MQKGVKKKRDLLLCEINGEQQASFCEWTFSSCNYSLIVHLISGLGCSTHPLYGFIP